MIIKTAPKETPIAQEQVLPYELAIPVMITVDAYSVLKKAFKGVSDEHMIQLFIRQLRELG